jgi:hypothetical protein
MRFADEPSERAPSRQATRLQRDGASGFSAVERGTFDQEADRPDDSDEDL